MRRLILPALLSTVTLTGCAFFTTPAEQVALPTAPPGPEQFTATLTTAINDRNGQAFFNALCPDDQQTVRSEEGEANFIAVITSADPSLTSQFTVGTEHTPNLYDGTFQFSAPTIKTVPEPVQYKRTEDPAYADGWCLAEDPAPTDPDDPAYRNSAAVNASVKADLRTMAILQENAHLDEGSYQPVEASPTEPTVTVGQVAFTIGDSNTTINVVAGPVGFCITGSNPDAAPTTWIYTSDQGLLPDRRSC